MTDQERPLTRRELRAREEAQRQAEAGQDPIDPTKDSIDAPEETEIDVSAMSAEEVDESGIDQIDTDAIEISPVNPDGSPRTRREIRQLREAALAELRAAHEADTADDQSAEPDDPLEAEVEADASEPIPATAPFSLEDLREAEQPSTAEEANIDSTDPEAATVEEGSDEEPAAGGPDEEPDGERAEGLDEPVLDLDESASLAEDSGVEDPDPILEDSTQASDAPSAREADADADRAEDDPQEYTFPDIQPPEEWRPVFDDPASRMGAASDDAAGSSEFDSLISRAVAQEGTTNPANTSALILPSHPDSTDGLTGPLGATGELFITGSIELPKAMGETGSHAALQDSDAFDAYISDEHPHDFTDTTDAGITPVSARAAVSAQVAQDAPVVAAPTREKSKLPLILALSGGGLVVIVGGIVVWAINSGVL